MILKFNSLPKIRKTIENKELAVVTGSFDLFHYSHLMFLKYVKENCDVLLVVIKSDKDVKLKGEKRPIINQFERANIVDAIKYVDYTIISERTHHTRVVDSFIKNNKLSKNEVYRILRDGSIFEKAKVNTLFVTKDKGDSSTMNSLCKLLKIKIKIIPVQGNDFHTSDIINKILK